MPDKATLEEYLVQIRRIPEHREAEAEKKIRKLFKELSEDLNAFLGNEYAKYAEDDRLTHAIIHQKGEYARFLEEVIKKVDGITPEVQAEVQELIENTYRVCYEGMVKGVEASKTVTELHEYFAPIKAITPETVKRAVKNPIKKLTLTRTLERNRKQIVANIRREIATGLTHGDRMSTMAERIQRHVGGNYKKSILIARTEAHRVREAGFYDAARKIDDILKEYSPYRKVKIWHTAKDEKVRTQNKHSNADHTIMEGQMVLVDEQFTLSDGHTTDFPGNSGIAAQDCNCRCRAGYRTMSDDEFFEATGRHFPQLNNNTDVAPDEMLIDLDIQHFNGKNVDNSSKTDIMKSGSDSVAKEEQRYGRNKDTTINNSYIESGEYRRKFDNITDNPDVNRVIYNKAKEMLKHRSGTLFEDMYWIDKETGDVVASALNEKEILNIAPRTALIKTISGRSDLIALHTHPQSMPPSATDFNNAFKYNYSHSLVLCHDGTIYGYSSQQPFSKTLLDLYIVQGKKDGLEEPEAYIKALNKIKKNYNIKFWEVK